MIILFHLPIPQTLSVEGWKTLPIAENNETLVKLNGLREDAIKIESSYFKSNIIGSTEDVYVREMVMNLLLLAQTRLPQGYKFLIFDAWRSLETQMSLFLDFKQQFKLEQPQLSEIELNVFTQKYVSLPSNDFKKPSPHSTGGSIDLTILDENGVPLKMGTEFDEMKPEAFTRFYELKLEENTLRNNEFLFLHNRRLLYHAMTSVGFTNYPEEWWHYDFGNQFWSKISNKLAFYSFITPNN